jgi:hypothetical protein
MSFLSNVWHRIARNEKWSFIVHEDLPSVFIDYYKQSINDKGLLLSFLDYSQKFSINFKGPFLTFIDFRQKLCINNKGPPITFGQNYYEYDVFVNYRQILSLNNEGPLLLLWTMVKNYV